MHYRSQPNHAQQREVERQVARLFARQHRADGQTAPFKRVAFIDKSTGRTFKYA